MNFLNAWKYVVVLFVFLGRPLVFYFAIQLQLLLLFDRFGYLCCGGCW